jgi:hypothetical protein
MVWLMTDMGTVVIRFGKSTSVRWLQQEHQGGIGYYWLEVKCRHPHVTIRFRLTIEFNSCSILAVEGSYPVSQGGALLQFISNVSLLAWKKRSDFFALGG